MPVSARYSGSPRERFRNDELVLNISTDVDRRVWDESKYEAFLDELCLAREYQKDAIKATLRYLLGRKYGSLRELADENYADNPVLEQCYGSWAAMERRLQLPEKLSATLDLATATGKSYVMYGIAVIMLAEGIVDVVLTLCPSVTIERGLIDKFRDLASNDNLRSLLPSNSHITSPSIINGTETIVAGSICVENYHAVLENSGSSIRTSLQGRGARALVLNDEAHHVANETAAQVKRWKDFLLDAAFGFRYIVGLSGTCYVKNDYFADVIYRYALRQAMDDRVVKRIEYIAEMPRTSDPDEKWQLRVNRHEAIRKRLSAHNIRPLSIIVTKSIPRCEDVAEDLRAFLCDWAGYDVAWAERAVLAIHSRATDIASLDHIDDDSSEVEWVVSVSMLNEGWDVKRVFQIVPHEERAFNSKLLIAQVLGRGLRLPIGWKGDQPVVTVFNHDAWAPSIRHLVNEVLERERRVTSTVRLEDEYQFDLHNIDYSIRTTSVKKAMDGPYNIFAKGYVDLASEAASEDVAIDFERAGGSERYRWKTIIQHRTYTARHVAEVMFERLQEADQVSDSTEGQSRYVDALPLQRVQEIVEASLARIGATDATESMRQRFLQSLGTLRRRTSENVRYTSDIDRYFVVSTRQKPAETVNAIELRRTKTIYYTDESRRHIRDEEIQLFDEIVEPGSGYKSIRIINRFDFKSPLNIAIAESENERRFLSMLLQPENTSSYYAWIKAPSQRFYEIDYAWKKGAHVKRGKFSPDFFIRTAASRSCSRDKR